MVCYGNLVVKEGLKLIRITETYPIVWLGSGHPKISAPSRDISVADRGSRPAAHLNRFPRIHGLAGGSFIDSDRNFRNEFYVSLPT